MGRLIAFVFGLLTGLFFGRLMTPPATPNPRRTSPVPGAAPRPAPPRPAPAPVADPLTEISGIGPSFEQALHAVGIHSFADLAQQDPDALAARLPARITAERIRRDRWIEQAQRKADEKAGS